MCTSRGSEHALSFQMATKALDTPVRAEKPTRNQGGALPLNSWHLCRRHADGCFPTGASSLGRGWLTPDTLPQLLPHVHRQALLSLLFLPHTSSSKATRTGAFFDARSAGCWLSTDRRSLLCLKYKIVSYSERSTQYNFKCIGQLGLIAPKGIHVVFLTS